MHTGDALRFGAIFPQTEIAADASQIRRYIEGVAELGFHHLVAYDHVMSGTLAYHPSLANRYNDQHPFQEILVLFGFVAAVAPALEVLSGVVILPQRQTALVAKQVATIDILTGGKTRLGIGTGWNDIEYQALGENFRNRGRRMEEQVTLLRTLWSDADVTFEGEWHTVDHAGLVPLPVQRPIPIWFGGRAEVALRRAARMGDGYMPNASDIETYQEQVRVIGDELARTDRDPAAFGFDCTIPVATRPEDSWKHDLDWWRDHGVTHVSMNTMGAGFTSVDQHLAALARGLDVLSVR